MELFKYKLTRLPKTLNTKKFEVLFQMKNNPPPFLQNSDAFQSFGRFDLEKYLDAVLNPGQIDWKPIEDFMQNVYLPSYKLQQYITNAAAISSKDVSSSNKELSPYSTPLICSLLK